MSDYTTEQQTVIDAAIAAATATQKKTNDWVQYDWSDRLQMRGDDQFAVFGKTAYHLRLPPVIEDQSATFEYRPVILNGRVFREYPEEGRVGILYLMRCTRRKGVPVDGQWSTAFLAARWLHTSELEQSNAEIAEHIAAEIDAGENVLTRKLPGWA